MKVVDAFWEKRNLGVDAVSFHIEKEDTIDDVIPVIEKNNRDYQTAIIDTSKNDILLELQNHGFRFIECSLSLSASVEKINIPEKLKRFQTQLGYRRASFDEMKMIQKIIRNGEIFKTDKIALDPYFGVKKAGVRYSFWIDDLISNGNNMYVVTFNDEIISFEVVGFSEGVVYAYLGGTLPCKAGKMLGAATTIPGTVFWKKNGAKEFRTAVSSNNPSIIKMHRSLGLDVVDCKYILIKHHLG